MPAGRAQCTTEFESIYHYRSTIHIVRCPGAARHPGEIYGPPPGSTPFRPDRPE